jgi:DNA-binding GntR family transcriptional regulator
VLVEQGRTSEDVNAFRRSDVRFHMRIAEIAACDLLRRAVEDARAELYVPFRAIALDQMLTVGVSQHARIVDALERHDPSRAGRAMATHLNATADQLQRLAGRADQRPAVD